MGSHTGPPGSAQRTARPGAYIIDYKGSYMSNRQSAAVQKFEVTVTGIKSRVSTWELHLLGNLV